MPDPSPAPACTNTWWPRSTSSRVPAGVRATRYSSVLISVGTPMRMRLPSPSEARRAVGRPNKKSGAFRRSHERHKSRAQGSCDHAWAQHETGVMKTDDTHFWHPFADMGSVRSRELVIDRAEDVWVWDTEGRQYLDATASLWYANVGHGRREIADAVARQMARLEAYSAFGDLSNEPART